jgi:phospholipase/lecithinase/hemolysin
MHIQTRTLGAMTLSAVCLAAALPSQAQTQNTDPLLLAILGVSNIVVTPKLVSTVAANANTWQFLIDVGAPYMSPYAMSVRQLALKQAPTLKPTASAPQVQGPTLSNSYSQVISFGDSMSDTGNMYAVTAAVGGVGMPTLPNAGGRFSNGPVVIEAMSNILYVPLLNYAYGGAQSGYGNLLPFYAMQQGMLKQVNDYLANLGSASRTADAKALYVLWTGPDDFYASNNMYLKSSAGVITANIKQGMVTLYQRGARNFFVPMMPDLSITPSARQHNKTETTYLASAKQRSSELAASVTAMLKAFAKQYPLAKVRTFDTYTYSQERMTQAAADGYDVTNPCYTPAFMGLPGPVCDSPDTHLFWDTNHPTAAGSLVIGTAFANAAVGPALPSK